MTLVEKKVQEIPMPTPTSIEKESKHGLATSVAHAASYLPALLEIFGLPKAVVRGVEHAMSLVPSLRKNAGSNGNEALRDAVNSRFVTILAEQQRLADYCNTLEIENAKIKGDLAGAAGQIEVLKADAQALRTQLESLQRRSLYLTVATVVSFLAALAALTVRLAAR
jgi:hypothetical protein